MNQSNFKGKDGLYIVYTGPSMNPTLRQRDLLLVKPYGERSIRTGDVIVFHSEEHSQQVVHRIQSIDGGRIRTRGDNNRHSDPQSIDPNDISGRVECAWRGKRQFAVHGGWLGRLIGAAFGAGILSQIANLFRVLFHPFYRALARTGSLSRLLPSTLKPKVFVYNGENGEVHRLLLGKRLIGSRSPDGDWQISPPYRLLVDESTLQ